MTDSIYIYRAAHFTQAVNDQPENLKAPLKARAGKTIRRLDRFSQLALIGAFDCCKGLKLPERTGLILVSSRGSTNNFTGVLAEIYRDRQPPSPLQFVATVSNAACFHICQQLNLNHSSLFLARTELPLEGALALAQCDLNAGKLDAVLIGLVSEVVSPIEVQRQYLGLAESVIPVETSCWLLLGNSHSELEPIAKIQSASQASTAEPNREAHSCEYQSCIDLIDQLNTEKSEITYTDYDRTGRRSSIKLQRV